MYNFPVIRHIDDVLPHIKDSEDFYVNHKERFSVVDYRVAFTDTFGHMDEDGNLPEADAIRRECRGLIFHKDGTIARRGFHKFFNVGEKPETAPEKLDLSRKDYRLLDKRDGSMIAPFILDGEVYWASMAGAEEFHEMVKAHVDNSTARYEEMIREFPNLTFIFEFCSLENRVVVGYENPELVLTAIRDTVNGGYALHPIIHFMEHKFGVPIVQHHPYPQDIETLIADTKALENSEGYVIAFYDGYRVKIKSDWYCALHKVRSYFDYEKDIVSLILNNGLDDLMPMLFESQKVKIEEYSKGLETHLYNHLRSTFHWRDEIIEKNMTRKDFALDGSYHPVVKNTIFHNWGALGTTTLEEFTDCIIKAYLNATGSHARWRDFKNQNGIALEW